MLTFSNVLKGGINGLKTIGSRVAHPIDTIKNTPVSLFGDKKPAVASAKGTSTVGPTYPGKETLDAMSSVSSGVEKTPIKTVAPAAPTAPAYNTQTGGLTDYGKSQGLPDVNAPKSYSSEAKMISTPIKGYKTATRKEIPSPYMSSVGGLQGIASGKNTDDYNQKTYRKANSTLQGFANNQTPAVIKAEEDYNKFSQQNPYMLAAQHNPNVAADIASGRSSLLGQTFAAESAAKQAAVSNALTGQQQQIGAANEVADQALTGQGQQVTAGQQAGALTAPVAGATYFGNPMTGGLQGGYSGGQGGGQTGNQLIDNSIQSAIDLVKRGGSTTDAMANLVGGEVAKNAFVSAMRQFDPNWTPTASNAIALQNMTQGQNYQEQATQLDTGLKQLDIIMPTALDFLQKSGLNNQDNPFFNKAIKEYASQLGNPADVKVLNALMADISKYTAQILGATGEINPTRVGEISETFDPSSLNASQLKTLLVDLKKLGDNQLSVLQNQSRSSYGGKGGYAGANVTPNTSLELGTPNPKAGITTSNPVLQGLIGGAMNAGVGGLNFLKGFAESILR